MAAGVEARGGLISVRNMPDGTTAPYELNIAYVDAIAEAPGGARPYGLWGHYAGETEELQRYAAMAKTEEGFNRYLDETYSRAVTA